MTFEYVFDIKNMQLYFTQHLQINYAKDPKNHDDDDDDDVQLTDWLLQKVKKINETRWDDKVKALF